MPEIANKNVLGSPENGLRKCAWNSTPRVIEAMMIANVARMR